LINLRKKKLQKSVNRINPIELWRVSRIDCSIFHCFEHTIPCEISFDAHVGADCNDLLLDGEFCFRNIKGFCIEVLVTKNKLLQLLHKTGIRLTYAFNRDTFLLDS
jgi:hypothetical protein